MIHTDIKTLEFIRENINCDTNKLLLNSKKYPDLDIQYVVSQIISRKAIRQKLPLWASVTDLIIPSKISTEQCSSESTALYKSELIEPNVTLCDLTGGMGVDSYYFSLRAEKIIYIERFDDYCQSAQHNFNLLKANNIQVLNADSRDVIDNIDNIDVFYVDPARRSDSNKRIFAINECEPDILSLKSTLLSKADTLIIKVSPMADIHFSLSLLPETTEVHCVSVKNECKELLFVLKNTANKDDIKIQCVNFDANNNKSIFSYMLKDESSIIPEYSNSILKYLYEPNSSIMKAGAFKSICNSFDVYKLGVNTHLYTSDILIPEFPGRIFEVISVDDFSSSTMKSLKKEFSKANITTRNFLMSVEDIRKKSGIKEGGDDYLFFSTISKDHRVIAKCKKA